MARLGIGEVALGERYARPALSVIQGVAND
jgi:hypothetical protein